MKLSKIKAKPFPIQQDFAIYLNGKEVNKEHESDDSEVDSRATTYTNLSNLSSRRPSSFDIWPDEIQLEHLSALSRNSLQPELSKNENDERKEEVFPGNRSKRNSLYPNTENTKMDYLSVKALY